MVSGEERGQWYCSDFLVLGQFEAVAVSLPRQMAA